MIEIVTLKGEKYSFDPDTMRIFKSGVLLSSDDAEPIFSDDAEGNPVFSGIYLKKENKILSRSGKINVVSDPDTIG
jgi:hypothetical protein